MCYSVVVSRRDILIRKTDLAGQSSENSEPMPDTTRNRMAMCWYLLKECLVWSNDGTELRLQRLLSAFETHKVEYIVVGA